MSVLFNKAVSNAYSRVAACLRFRYATEDEV
jgi:hypothetical protein